MGRVTLPDLLFWGLAAGAVLSGCVVAFSTNIVRSAFALLATLGSAAGLYALLGLDLLAGVQLLVYVGGVLVLMVFAIMMTHRISDVRLSSPSRNGWPVLLLVSAPIMLLLIPSVVRGVDWGRVRADLAGTQDRFSRADPPRTPRLSEVARRGADAEGTDWNPPTTAATGDAFLGEYLLPFEAVSVLLLAALVGAAVVVKKELLDEDEPSAGAGGTEGSAAGG